MTITKMTLIGGIAALAALAVPPFACAQTAKHAELAAAADYVRDRLAAPDAAWIAPRGEPFEATAIVNGERWTGRAMTFTVRTRLGPRGLLLARRKTILVLGNGVFLLRNDVGQFTRVPDPRD